jgi:hypothetical protein
VFELGGHGVGSPPALQRRKTWVYPYAPLATLAKWAMGGPSSDDLRGWGGAPIQVRREVFDASVSGVRVGLRVFPVYERAGSRSIV